MYRLREAALSEANSWHVQQLPDYAQLECISRGNKVLGKKGDERVLESDEVNTLVRHYSHLDESLQATEEWWAGAVALDYFLKGLPTIVKEITTTGEHTQHRWRAWVVNTQTSRQRGSHWFTVVVGTEVSDNPSTADELPQSDGEDRATASCSQALGTARAADQLQQSTGEHQAVPLLFLVEKI